MTNVIRIGICAPSTPLSRHDGDIVAALVAEGYPQAELVISDQCYAVCGHFAGDDKLRCDTFVDIANDPDIDVIWFARGGYGAARIAGNAISQLTGAAYTKTYLGYSDGGNLLGALYRAGIGRQVHGPMPIDIVRNGGKAALRRALDWLVHDDAASLEGNIVAGQKYAAFNLMTLAMMTGTPLMPDLAGHVLMIEEVSEHLYAFDRLLFHVTGNLADTGLTGIRLGRVSDIPENDRPFGEDVETITRRWCEHSGIAYLGSSDIGHDAHNKIVPFG